jgi:hypothetical protein
MLAEVKCVQNILNLPKKNLNSTKIVCSSTFLSLIWVGFGWVHI